MSVSHQADEAAIQSRRRTRSRIAALVAGYLGFLFVIAYLAPWITGKFLFAVFGPEEIVEHPGWVLPVNTAVLAIAILPTLLAFRAILRR